MKQLYKTLTVVLCFALYASVSAQVRTVTFTGRDRTNQYHIPLHHVKVFNLDQLWEEVLYYPDTALTMGTVGIEGHELLTGLQLMQNVPNPFDGTTEFVLFLPEDNDVALEIYDLTGKLTVSQQYTGLPMGAHLFRAMLVSPQTYLLGASTRDGRTTIKMVNEGHGGENSIQHIGMVNGNGDITVYLKNDRAGTPYPFSVGDEMKYTGYAEIDNAEVESNTVVKQQVDNETVHLSFDFTLPTVTIISINDVADPSITCSCNVVSDGGAMVTARGVCWSTSPSPTFADNHLEAENGTGAFTCTISGLTAGTTYYVRAYATNAVGTAFSNEQSFTKLVLPTVTTNTVSNISSSTAICGGNVTTDGGHPVTARGVCWSTSQNPTISNSHTADSSGTGSFTSALTGLATGTTYYVRAYATSSVGTAYGNQRSFTTTLICGNNVADYDGNYYNTVQIGQQCWMKQNLKTTHFTNGVSIPLVQDSIAWGNTTSAAYCYYNKNTYGCLYNFYAVENGQLCPNGWHVPTYDEVHTTLYNALEGTSVGGKMKATGTTYWLSPNTGATNSSGFSARGGGCRPNSDAFHRVKENAVFWTSTSYNANYVKTYSLSYNSANLTRYGYEDYDYSMAKRNGCSVRCLRNVSSTATTPTVTTNTVSDVTNTTATCGGNVTADGGATVTARGVCWNTSPNPNLSSNLGFTNNGGGTGNFISSITGLSAGTTFYVKAYATNSAGTAYGEQRTFTTNSSSEFTCGNTVTDQDNNVYNTVQIGDQCWMKENLRTTKLNNGVSIPLAQDSTAWLSSASAAYCYSNINSYGCLYNFYAVAGGQLCPTGWHVPTYDEVHTSLYNTLEGTSVGGKMKTTGTTYWLSPNTGATNSSGFSARGGGYRPPENSICKIKEAAVFWTSTIYDSWHAYDYMMEYDLSDLYLYGDPSYDYSMHKLGGLSVRCLRGNLPQAEVPTVTTSWVYNISYNTATCVGNVSASGNAPITERGVCWSTTQNPTINDSHTSEGGGMLSFTSNIIGLSAGTTYYVRAYATNSAGTAYGVQKTFTTTVLTDGQPCAGAATVTDRDNNVYNTVQIGWQCWMKENLRTTQYANGVFIPLGTDTSTVAAYRYNPNNSANNVSTYGYLYNWKAVMRNSSSSNTNPSGVQGICPNGWHVPSDAEWEQLTNYMNFRSQYECSNSDNSFNYIAKALSATINWNSSTNECAVGNNLSANNAAGFSALPAGNYYGYYGGSFSEFGSSADFWSSTQYSYGLDDALITGVSFDSSLISNYATSKSDGRSVRCLRN